MKGLTKGTVRYKEASLVFSAIRSRVATISFSSVRVRAVTVVSLAAVVSLFLALYQVHAQPLPANAGIDASSAGNVSSSTVATMRVPVPDINIASDGLVLLRDAHVTAIDGTSITLAVSFGAASFSWIAQTDARTKFPIAGGKGQTFANIRVGDVVTVTGMIESGGAVPTILAQFVRE